MCVCEFYVRKNIGIRVFVCEDRLFDFVSEEENRKYLCLYEEDHRNQVVCKSVCEDSMENL